jgi:hypothetical protein
VTLFGDDQTDVHNMTGSVNITGSLNLPDDVSLKFGNDGDLEIFHKADTYSRIKDNGTGALQLSSNRFKVMNSSNNETMIDATQNAGVDLYFDDSKKLETKTDGINVTGDISASGNFILGDLGGGPFISGSQGGLQVSGSGITIHNGSADGVLKIQRFSGDIGQLSAANTRFTIRALSNKNISIEDDAGNVGVFVKDGGKVGIGADTTPTTALQVTGDISASGVIEAQSHISTSGDIRLIGGANNIIFGEPGDTTSQNYGIQTDGNLYLDIDKDNDNTGNFFQFRSNQATTNIMRIKDTGEVGIGTTSPPKTLTVAGDISASGDASIGTAVNQSAVNAYGTLQVNQNADNDESGIGIQNRLNGRSLRIYVDSSNNSVLNSGDGGGQPLILNEGAGKVGIGTTTLPSVLTVDGDMKATHITASGNISASGIITAEHFLSSDDAVITDDLTVGGNISGSSITTASFAKATIGTATPENAHTALTVNGGSGGNHLAYFERTIGGTGFVSINANSSDPQMRFYANNTARQAAIGVDNTNGNLVFATGSSIAGKDAIIMDTTGNLIITGSGNLVVDNLGGGGHITASGNYSGSAGSTFRIGGKLIAGSKSFLINTPDGNKLEYGVLEGQQNDIFFRGELKGDSVIYLPKEWEWLVDENTITVQLTSIGKHQDLFVKEIKDNKIFIDITGVFKTKQDIHCYHIIHGTRKDVELIRNYQ